ncbi:GNAT family N-acetyltransferase [Rhodobacterales bacterium]|nr:GNAT family N-acetyltransferase [Rhodobacterales bacterium]
MYPRRRVAEFLRPSRPLDTIEMFGRTKVQTIFLECGSVKLVPFTPADIKLVKDLHTDLYGNRCSDYATNCTVTDAEEFVRSVLQTQSDLGFAKWKAVSDDGKFLGWAGFTQVSETSEISLNYCLQKEVLERDTSLARRLCRALSDWFFKNTYFSHLVAVVRTDNRDVRNVVKQAGFYHRESKVIDGMQADVFQLLSPSMQSYLMTA